MAKFKEMNEYLNDVLLKIVQSQNLCKYINYESNEADPSDPLDQPNLTLNQRKELMYTRIFPFAWIPDETDVGTYLTVIFDNVDPAGGVYFKNSTLTFDVICHKNQWRLLGGLRPYALLNEIDLLFNNQGVIGIGKMQFAKCRYINYNKSFKGYMLQYRFVDFS